MTITRQPYGHIAGKAVDRFVIANQSGYRMGLITYGARLTEFHVPDEHGTKDVVLGLDSLEAYVESWACMGATCGRYANRIRHGELIVGGERHQLAINWRDHHIHGGAQGFDRQIWNAEIREPENAMAFSLTSPDGDEGYPGEVMARVVYRLEEDGLAIAMEARSTRPTAINLVHHSYWNLAGHQSGTAGDHTLTIAADHYTPFDGDLMPTGEIAAVEGTPFDLRQPRLLSQCFAALARQGQEDGYDNNWCLNGGRGTLRPVATLAHPGSGRRMILSATEPGLQVFTCGSFAPSTPGKNAGSYGPAAGVALETQAYPDTPHHPEFPRAWLSPGEVYRHEMRFEFSSR